MRPAVPAVKRRKDAAKWISPNVQLVIYTITVTCGVIFSTVWFFRDKIWMPQSNLREIESCSQAKALLRISNKLLDEAMRDVSGLRDSIILQSLDVRAIAARSMLSSERDRGVLDDLVVSLHRDTQKMSSDESFKKLADRTKLKTSVDQFQDDISMLLGRHFLEGNVEFVRPKVSIGEEDENAEQAAVSAEDEDIPDEKHATKAKVAKAKRNDEDRDPDDDDDDGDT